MQFGKPNSVTLHFEDSAAQNRGDLQKPALVFINSLGTDFRSWQQVVPAFAERFRIIRYDKRGHGLSEAPDAPYTMDQHIDDLAGLLKQLGVRDAVVVGLSIGGLIAMGLATHYPDLVRALVLSNTAAKIGTPEMWQQRMDTISEGGIEALSTPILERWFSASYRASHPDEMAGWHAMLTRTPVQGYLGSCAAIRDTDFRQAVSSLSLPTLCIAGSDDGATPPDLVRETAGLIPDAAFAEIAGVGHLPCIEAPQVMIAEIETFFEERNLV